tara:strand:- start:515 stop:976 length:462 start_codon:yes stop_codon:yes gene_type:complete
MRCAQLPIYHIRLAFDNNYHGLPKYAPIAKKIKAQHLFQQHQSTTQFIPTINIMPTDNIINKTYGDVFHGNQLLTHLKKIAVDKIIFTGLSTDNAILNSANTAICHDFYVTIVHDACGAPTESAHQNALHIMQDRTASEIISTKKLLEDSFNL